MKYKKIDHQTYVISLAPSDEIIAKLNLFLTQEKIDNAYFFGIGALKSVELAHYRVDTKKYSAKSFNEPMEITNLTGNVFLYDNQPLVHAHVTLGKESFETIGGHLVNGVVAAACEIILVKLPSELKKRESPQIGLKILDMVTRF